MSGNGTYTTPTGYTLPCTAVAGTYQWNATYNGDSNNNTASDINDCAEQVTVAGCPINSSCTSYNISGPGICGTETVSDLRGNTYAGDTVQVSFDVTQAGGSLSLVSYTAPGATFDPTTAYQQLLFQTATITNASLGWHTLTVLIPNSYYQVDFVCGPPITTFGAAGSCGFYSAQGRLFSADNGGSQAYANSSLCGYVYRDSNNNGLKDSGESGIANVTLTLSATDICGNKVSATTKTISSGYYVFGGLNASSLAGYTITEAQPSGYNHGKDSVGSLGGTAATAKLTTYQVNCNSAGANYNFGERPLAQIADGANFAEDYAPLLASADSLQTGEFTVAVDGLSSDLDVASLELARINDAISALNLQLGSFQIHFSLVTGADAANAQIHLQIAATSDLGSMSDGVLGATSGDDVTIIDGWNWYLGADPTAIGAGQYDFQSVVMHELGHTVGLGESTDPTSVMYEFLAAGQVHRSLSDSDLAFIADEQDNS